jgi:hypothetical protein
MSASMNADGDCFVVAAHVITEFESPNMLTGSERECADMLRALQCEQDDIVMVHGLVTRAEDEHVHCHAWLEVPHKRLVFDYSNGNSAICMREDYYRIGRIVYTTRYSRAETVHNMLDHGTYGSWVEAYE